MPVNRVLPFLASPAPSPAPPVQPALYQVLDGDGWVLAEHDDADAVARLLALFADEFDRGDLGLLPPTMRQVREGDRLMDGSRARSRAWEPLSQMAERVRDLRRAGLGDDFRVPDLDDFVRPGGIAGDSGQLTQ